MVFALAPSFLFVLVPFYNILTCLFKGRNTHRTDLLFKHERGV